MDVRFVVFILGVLALIALVGWWLRLGRLRGTTLGVPWHVTIAAVLLLLGTEACVAVWGASARWARPLQFAAAASLFCPAMALLGAKRPQHKAWTWIVLTLWLVLALPAFELIALGRADDLELRDVRAWFLWVLILLEAGHRLGTRRWLAGGAQAAAELLLFAPYLPLVRATPTEPLRLVAAGLAVLALVVQVRPLSARKIGYSRVWLDFRDLFGTPWALRVLERVNAAAVQYEWPLRLRWRGFERTDGAPWSDDQVPAELPTHLGGLLRRFVDEDWIARRR